MAERKTAKKSTQQSAKSTKPIKTLKGFTAEERAAMNERSRELKTAARATKDNADGEGDVPAAIAAMQAPDRAMANRVHAIINASAPALCPITWYGMPAYAND